MYDTITIEFLNMFDNSFDFPLRYVYNGLHPCLGISSQMDVQRRAAVVLALELEYQHQLLIIAERRLIRRRRRRAPVWWVRPWLTPARKLEYGHYNRLMQELRVEDENAFANYVRLPPHMFDELLNRTTTPICDQP